MSFVCQLQDIILFEAILADLFPGTQLSQPDQQQLTTALHSACGQLGLQPEAPFLAKAAQLHDTLGVRFGVMLVGPAGEGRGTVPECCADFLICRSLVCRT
jgi:dynein heavy chain